MIDELMSGLYKPYYNEIQTFGSAWCGPDHYAHAEEALVARYEACPGDDGQTVEIFCTAMPARFYTMRALADQNSCGDPLAPFEMTTGSSQAQLVVDMAKAISEGMLGLCAKSDTGD